MLDIFTHQAISIPMEDVSGEVCWVKIETDDNPLYVGSFYRTPSDKSTYQLDELHKSLHNINLTSRNNPNATVVVAGDFNLGDVDWDSGIVPHGPEIDLTVKNYLTSYALIT